MTQNDEVTRLYAEVERRAVEADEAWAEYKRHVAQTAEVYATYQEKAEAERDARQVWMAAGDKVFAA